MNIPTKSGESYEIPAAVVDAYRVRYLDADGEFAKMLIWLESNRSRRPASPKSGPRFVANWFKRVRPAAQMAASKAVRATQRGHMMDILTGGRDGYGHGHSGAGYGAIVSEDGRILDRGGRRDADAGPSSWGH